MRSDAPPRFISPTAAQEVLVNQFMAAYVRPCSCIPIELREQRTGQFECAFCSRQWVPRG